MMTRRAPSPRRSASKAAATSASPIRAGYEKFGWAMDLLAGLVGEAVAPPNANTAPAPQPQPQQAPATSTPPEPPDANFETDDAFKGWVPSNPPPEET
jgi:hypothetical protein